MNVLRNIQKDLEEQKITIRQSGDSITEKVTQNLNRTLEDKFSIWEEKQNILREKVENQEKRIYFLEKQARKRNIVFFGIEENETSYENLEKSILQWIDTYLSIKLEQRDVQEVKRVGKKGGTPRPIIATFSTLGLKINIFKQKRRLKDTPFYMKEDYPRYVLEKRKELQEQVKLEAQKGNKAIIKYDKLIILKNNNYKRTLSNSPENCSQVESHKNIQTVKKNKTLKQHTLGRRSNSVSESTEKPNMLNFFLNKNVSNQYNIDTST